MVNNSIESQLSYIAADVEAIGVLIADIQDDGETSSDNLFRVYALELLQRHLKELVKDMQNHTE